MYTKLVNALLENKQKNKKTSAVHTLSSTISAITGAPFTKVKGTVGYLSAHERSKYTSGKTGPHLVVANFEWQFTWAVTHSRHVFR